MGFLGADIFTSTPDYAGIATTQEQQRQQAIQQGSNQINQAFSGFTPSFYQKRVKAYTDFAMPQLAQQYQTNRNQIGFNLANRNLLQGSGTANQQWSNLNRAMGTEQQGIADTGTAQSQALQQQVEAQRQTLLGQLYQSADPAGAGQGATQAAATFAQPSVFPAVGNLFANLANQYYLGQLINTGRQPTSYVATPPSYSVGSGGLPGQVSY